ncbi:hypothetical protein [Caulobacter hibisci]|uniref:DUF2147 domain-containing protein n=1 Tax=Caulobacter hibisci TaxID=2035993 RepID=A0ABS0T1I6_9CAUL|nr:hypothetical protein [Caulobacter hibisci]MBI1685743.1 hypothetical protein [Caulobacter hibisci]
MIAALLAAAALAATPPPLVLRDGVWTSDCGGKTDCDQLLVRGGALIGEDEGKPVSRPLRLIPGDPPLLQLDLYAVGDFLDLNEAADTQRNYLGVEIKARDGQGRITSLKVWPIRCDEPPEGKALGMAGVRWEATRHACLVDGKDPIRAAAPGSRDDDGVFSLFSFRWLRDPAPGDQTFDEPAVSTSARPEDK